MSTFKEGEKYKYCDMLEVVGFKHETMKTLVEKKRVL